MDATLNLDFGPKRRILMSGGTGFIGSRLCRELLASGHEVTILSRHPGAAIEKFEGRVRAIQGTQELRDDEVFDVIVNLSGAPVIGPPWTEKRRKVLLASRLGPTAELLDFVRRAGQRPELWIQASAIGYYDVDEPQVDEEGPRSPGFAGELCGRWEQMSEELDALGLRRVVLRFGLVFARRGGALPLMALPFRWGFGAVIGPGSQHVGWIHLDDLLSIMAAAIREQRFSGIYNVVAPDCPEYQQFAREIGRALHRPVFLWAPAKVLRLIMGEMSTLLVDGPVVLPRRLQESGYVFRHPDLRKALTELL